MLRGIKNQNEHIYLKVGLLILKVRLLVFSLKVSKVLLLTIFSVRPFHILIESGKKEDWYVWVLV